MGEPAVEPLLLGLADAFVPVDAEAAHDHIGALAGRLSGVPDDPAAQVAAIGARILASFQRPGRLSCPSTIDDLLLPRVLDEARGDDLLVAAAAVVAGHRRGWDVGVVRTGDRVLVAHAGLLAVVASVADDGRLVDARDIASEGEDLWWCEPHGLAELVLDRTAARADDLGLHHVALRAAELACALPAAPREHLARAVRLARVRARFN